MTALALQSVAPPPAPNWADLITAADAARLLGKSVKQVRRICGELAASGRAYLGARDGGKPQWWISRTYDRRLHYNPADSIDFAKLDTYTGKQRRLAMLRAKAVDRFRDALNTRPGLVADWLPTLLAELDRDLPELGGVSRASLYKWHRVYLRVGDIEKLIDKRGGKQSGQR